MPRFLIADDHDVVCQGVQMILAQAFPGAVVSEAHHAGEIFAHLRAASFDALILDIGLPGQSGIEVLKEIKVRYPHLPVLILSAHDEKQYAIRALKIGAAGYLNKSGARHELAQAMKQILGGEKYLTPVLAAQMAEYLVEGNKSKSANKQAGGGELLHESLTDREHQVLCLLAQGKKNGEIAREMMLSVSAVSTYRARVLKKLQVESTAELIRYAVEHDLRI